MHKIIAVEIDTTVMFKEPLTEVQMDYLCDDVARVACAGTGSGDEHVCTHTIVQGVKVHYEDDADAGAWR